MTANWRRRPSGRSIARRPQPSDSVTSWTRPAGSRHPRSQRCDPPSRSTSDQAAAAGRTRRAGGCMAEPRTRAAIAADYQRARAAADGAAMARYQNEEACFILLSILERLAADQASFIHGVAIKGGILMAGELGSPRASADIDATSGAQKRVEPDTILHDLRQAGRPFNLRQDRRARADTRRHDRPSPLRLADRRGHGEDRGEHPREPRVRSSRGVLRR